MVNKMDDERLMALAAESDEIREEREHLRGQLESLQQGLEKCRRYGGRPYNGKLAHNHTLILVASRCCYGSETHC